MTVEYINNYAELRAYLAFLEQNGWTPITYTTSQRTPDPYDQTGSLCGRNAHDVIGQEFSKVVLVMDQNFSYDNEGKLTVNPSYTEFTRKPKPGHVVIGRGEAASLALAKSEKGIVASNNLKDISQYITEYQLSHKTTGDILTEALDSGLITEQEGNTLWANMLKKRRKLGANSFTEYLKLLGR